MDKKSTAFFLNFRALFSANHTNKKWPDEIFTWELDLRPFIGDNDDGSMEDYTYLFKLTEAKSAKSGAKWTQKIDVLNQIFQKYITQYFWAAPVS